MTETYYDSLLIYAYKNGWLPKSIKIAQVVDNAIQQRKKDENLREWRWQWKIQADFNRGLMDDFGYPPARHGKIID